MRSFAIRCGLAPGRTGINPKMQHREETYCTVTHARLGTGFLFASRLRLSDVTSVV